METSRRGNYDSGEDFVLEYGELRFTFNEEDFSERCEQAALKLGFVGGRLGDGRARRPRQPRRQRRDPRSRLGPGRARQRLLARARRPGRALAGALAAPPGLPRRLARPARQRGRARASPSTKRPAASPTCSPSTRACDGIRPPAASRSNWRPSPPGAASPTPDASFEPPRGPSRSPSRRPRRRAAPASACRSPPGRGAAGRCR